jgi:DNA-binding MarR family transcriptional regulator
MASWGLFSNHGLALICIAREPESRLRDIAGCVGITERAASRIVGELCEDGYVSRIREGRRNRYKINGAKPLPHALTDGTKVQAVLAPLVEG